jgi:hypothetical protein
MLSVFLLNSANRKIICEKITSKGAESNSALLFETVSGMTESPTLNLSQTALPFNSRLRGHSTRDSRSAGRARGNSYGE